MIRDYMSFSFLTGNSIKPREATMLDYFTRVRPIHLVGRVFANGSGERGFDFSLSHTKMSNYST